MTIALVANLTMFVIGIVGWHFAKSTSLLADAFDMLAEASGYIVALLAIGRSAKYKKSTRQDGTVRCSSCWA